MFHDFYRGKRVLVIGHTGFKGSWLSQWLCELGAQVSGFSVDLPSTPCHFDVLNLKSRIQHFEGDIRNLEALSAAFEKAQPQIVFHLAAQALVRPAYDDPKKTFDTNIGGTVNVMESLRLYNKAEVAVIITSDKCYENVEWEFGYREPDRLGGGDPYSASKAAAEIVFSAYARSYFKESGCRTRVATTRAGNVIGGGDWAKDRIVADCMRSWSKNEATLIRSPNATRPWQHVLEPLSGYLALGAALGNGQPELHGESFNFGPPTDKEKSVGDLIAALAETWPNARWEKDPAGQAGKKEAGLLKLNCDRALRRLNWKATLTMDESIRMTGEWYQIFYSAADRALETTKQHIRSYEQFARERGVAWANPTSSF